MEKERNTSTQTGEDHLYNYSPDDAFEYLKKVWWVEPRWVPQRVGITKYPFISAKEYSGIAGPACPLPSRYWPLLDIQREKGFLTSEEIPEDEFTKRNHIDIVGAHPGDGEKQSNRYLLDPISGVFLHMPESMESIQKYHEFYTIRMAYTETLSEAYKFLGQEVLPGMQKRNNRDTFKMFGQTIVFICGLGTGGGETAIRLGKQMPGVQLVLIDGGVFGPENIDRQATKPANIGLNKALTIANTIFTTNPMLPPPICIPFHINEENISGVFSDIIDNYQGAEPPIIQIIDEIDITEKETLYSKAVLHETAIKIAAERNHPVYVHWSIDIGASGETIGTCRYTGNESRPLGGNYTRRHAALPAMYAVSQLVPKNAIGLEMIEDIKNRFFRQKGDMKNVSQSGLSAIGVAKGISTRVILTTLGYGEKLKNQTFNDDVRGSFKSIPRLISAIKRIPFIVLITIWLRIKRGLLFRELKKQNNPGQKSEMVGKQGKNMDAVMKGSGALKRFGEGNIGFAARMILFAVWLLVSSTIAFFVTPVWWAGSKINQRFNLYPKESDT